MLRGTVRKVHALGDVSVTIDGKYGAKSLIRMKSRVPVDVGERVFVEDVSPLPDRAHDWVLFGKLTEIGEWATPAPHTHPIGQVTGLVDWLTKYETWMGDHEKRMSDAEALIKAGTDAVADTRAVLAETRTDLADAVKRVAVQEVFADKASARLDQAERDIHAGGDRIGATEAAIRSANDSLESAKTVIQKTQADLADGPGLAQKVAKFLTVSAMTGVFTKSLTAADAKLLGQTVADSFTANKVAARDIIATGTVDLAQLNVTGPMSASIIKASDISARRAFFTEGLTAENATLLGQTVADNLVVSDTFAARVVNAMSTNTKRLVVTDDAILNRATIVQSLVTPELITQKADIGVLAASMITSGALQTSTAANRGVKIDNAGIRAWDDTGQQTIRLNGSDNLVQGTFQTGTTGARIKINAVNTTAFMDLYGNSGGRDHGTIYYDAAVPGKTDAALTLTAIKDYSTSPENPSFRLFPTRGTFAFQGRWASETDPIKFMVIQNNAGLAANAYNTFKIAYSTPFPTKSAIRFPLISIESENGADVMATIVAQTAKDITINAINKSGGKASGRIILKVVTFNTDNTQA